MRHSHSHLQVRVHQIDGSTRTFIQNESELVNATLTELHPAALFTQSRITVADGDSHTVFLPPLVTRIDLITDRLSVWEFPFVLGAPVELTESEFMAGLDGLPQRARPTRSDMPVFLDIEMVNGERVFLWMQVVAGMTAARLGKIYSLFSDRRLIFGLRTDGIGVLNLANVMHFAVHPEPAEVPAYGNAVHGHNGEQTLTVVAQQARRISAR